MALLIFVIVYAFRQRAQTAAPQLMVAAFFMLVWASGSFAELLSSQLEHMILWRNITQIGVFYSPVASLLFSMAYSGIPIKTRKRLGLFLYIFQSVSITLIFTDSWLHLMRTGINVVQSGNFSTITVESTLLAQLLISVNFVLLAASFILLIICAVRTSSKMRRQVILTTSGMGVTFIFAFLKVASAERFAPGMPISGVFGIVCLAMLLGIIRYSFLKVLPVAHSEVMNIIDEGIVVASPKGEILDVNDAALRFFSRGLAEPIQRSERGLAAIEELLQCRYSEWCKALLSYRPECLELSQTANGETYYYQCSIYPLDGKVRRTLGTISAMRDITQQKMQNDLLKRRAEHDGLLGILNRQTFFERARMELMLSEGENSLVFFDVDDFKKVNDTFGHIAGDHALRAVCTCVQRIIGQRVLFGRTGGEEFAILFQGTGLQPTHVIAERIRTGIEQEHVHHQGQTFGVTISIGIASGTGLTMQQLYQRADLMLYQAKASGKNCCAI